MFFRKCISIKKITKLFIIGLFGCLWMQTDLFSNIATRASLWNPLKNRSAMQQEIVWYKKSTPTEVHRVPQKPEIHRLLGNPRDNVGFLTFGLCTVPREESYFIQTLTSLISIMSMQEKNTTVIVVFLSSDNVTWTNETLSTLQTAFAYDITIGLLHVIQPDPSIYPNFSNITKRTFGDDLKRVHWRTKQNIDFAYLFSYCRNISEYYIHIEDDVLTQPNAISVIRESIKIKLHLKLPWFCMEFSPYGFIGKLFHSSDLQLIKKFLLMFKVEMPGDWLVSYLWKLMAQEKVVKGKTTLFRHIGKVSSLKGQFYDKNGRSYMNHEEFLLQNTTSSINPDGVFETSIVTNSKYKPELSYRNQTDEDCFFWGKTPKLKDYFRIILTQHANVSEILIISGHPAYNKDIIEGADVQVYSALDGKGKCVDGKKVGKFNPNGSVKVTFIRPVLTKCVAIIITKSSDKWVIIRHFRINIKDL